MKYHLLPAVVILPDEEGFLLFRPETGKFLQLNRSGAWLCSQLAKGMDESELPALLHAAGAPEKALPEAEAFFRMLRAENLLIGENEERKIPPVRIPRADDPQMCRAGAEDWDDRPLYDAGGMKGEFSGRESLRLKPLAPQEFRCGDILLCDVGKAGYAGKVRRVVGRTKQSLILSGDAKASPREELPFSAEGCFLVTEKLYPGALRRPVARRMRGRMRHIFFFLASSLAGPAGRMMERLLPLMVWRLPLALWSIHKERWFCFRKKRIAMVTSEGYCYLSPWYRLWYRIPSRLRLKEIPNKEFSRS